MSDLPERSGGLRILVVEDEMLIAEMIAETLRDAGCEVVGPATSLEPGKTLANNADLDGAFLDINLVGKVSFAIADILMQRGIPVAFLTGYQDATIPELYRHCARLSKPFQLHELMALAQRHFAHLAHRLPASRK
jgi:DNA-binding response OmpR family regulator